MSLNELHTIELYVKVDQAYVIIIHIAGVNFKYLKIILSWGPINM